MTMWKMSSVVLLGMISPLISSCDQIQSLNTDPNLKMTFSCHGNRSEQWYRVEGKPSNTNEPISHSVTFFRKIIRKPNESDSYKITKYIFDYKLIDIKKPKTGNFVTSDQFGYFSHFLFSDTLDPEKKMNRRTTIFHFNFITKTLTFEESVYVDREGSNHIYNLKDITKCERVTDSDTLKEIPI